LTGGSPGADLLQAHTDYALGLHRALRDTVGRAQGLAWSPFSVWGSLAMAAVGAGGQTAEELASVLAPGRSAEELRALFLTFPRLDGDTTGAAVVVENTAWADVSLRLAPPYETLVADWAGGNLCSIDFHLDPEAAREHINLRVSETTRGLIPQLIESGRIDDSTVLVLVNALYAQAAWSETFAPSLTTGATFLCPDGPRQVATMHGQLKARHVAGGGWQAVGLPTRSARLAVSILMPDDDLVTAENELDAPALLALHDRLAPANVTLALPRFSLGLHVDLVAVLVALGVRRPFSSLADFSAISPGVHLQISFVAHEAILRVDEAGIEAAAATATGIRRTSAMTAPTVSLNVDRPFLVTVRDRESGLLLFLGRVLEPDPSYGSR